MLHKVVAQKESWKLDTLLICLFVLFSILWVTYGFLMNLKTTWNRCWNNPPYDKPMYNDKEKPRTIKEVWRSFFDNYPYS